MSEGRSSFQPGKEDVYTDGRHTVFKPLYYLFFVVLQAYFLQLYELKFLDRQYFKKLQSRKRIAAKTFCNCTVIIYLMGFLQQSGPQFGK